MDTKRGKWTFNAVGATGVKSGYTVTSTSDSSTRENGVWREEHRSSTHESHDFPHWNFTVDLPAGKPGPLHAVGTLANGTLKTSKMDVRAEVFLVPEYRDLELVVELEGV